VNEERVEFSVELEEEVTVETVPREGYDGEYNEEG
jgi:hypothetical protein